MEKIRLDYMIILLLALLVVLSGIQIRSKKVMNTFENTSYFEVIK